MAADDFETLRLPLKIDEIDAGWVTSARRLTRTADDQVIEVSSIFPNGRDGRAGS